MIAPAKLLPALLLMLLAGCGTTRLPIAYTPASPPAALNVPVVSAVTASDERGEQAADANWLGTIRGGFGNPIKRLEADRPVSDVVAAAAREALRARGLLGEPAAPFLVQVRVLQLESDQMARREAKVRLRFVWTRARGGRPAFENRGEADVVTGSLITFEAGVFGSVDALQATVAQALSKAIDQALDDPALRTFLSGNPRRDRSPS